MDSIISHVEFQSNGLQSRDPCNLLEQMVTNQYLIESHELLYYKNLVQFVHRDVDK